FVRAHQGTVGGAATGGWPGPCGTSDDTRSLPAVQAVFSCSGPREGRSRRSPRSHPSREYDVARTGGLMQTRMLVRIVVPALALGLAGCGGTPVDREAARQAEEQRQA